MSRSAILRPKPTDDGPRFAPSLAFSLIEPYLDHHKITSVIDGIGEEEASMVLDPFFGSDHMWQWRRKDRWARYAIIWAVGVTGFMMPQMGCTPAPILVFKNASTNAEVTNLRVLPRRPWACGPVPFSVFALLFSFFCCFISFCFVFFFNIFFENCSFSKKSNINLFGSKNCLDLNLFILNLFRLQN